MTMIKQRLVLFMLVAGLCLFSLNYLTNAQSVEGIRTMTYSPDGTMLAISGFTAAPTGYFRVVDANNHNNVIADFSQHPDIISVGALSLSWSPDGTRIITTSAENGNQSIFMWSVSYTGYAPGSLITSTPEIPGFRPCIDVKWSPDGQYILARYLDGTGLWRVNGSSIELTDSTEAITKHIAWHPSSHQFALTSAIGVTIWDINNGQIVDVPFEQRYIGPENGRGSFAVTWNSDGTQIAFGIRESNNDEAETIFIYDYTQSPPSEVLQFDSTSAIATPELVWSSDDNWLGAITGDNKLRIWNAHTGDLLPLEQDALYPSLFNLEWHPITNELLFTQDGTTITTLNPTAVFFGQP